MTQPVTAPATGGHVIASAALGLALIAIEQQVRDAVTGYVHAAFATLAATAVVVAATAPATVLTGVALLSLPALHQQLVTQITTLNTRIRATVRTAYTVSSRTAYSGIRADLNEDDLPDSPPTLDSTLDSLLRDVDTMTGHAQTDFQNRIAVAYDSSHDPATRTLAIHTAATAVESRLTDRATKAATTAAHRGANDTQNALFNHYQQSSGIPGLMKRWRTTSINPCGMCEALNGTLVGVNAEFDHTATTDDRDLRSVWRNLSGPPRHPNCRCQLELVKT